MCKADQIITPSLTGSLYWGYIKAIMCKLLVREKWKLGMGGHFLPQLKSLIPQWGGKKW